jgi:tRNA(fMet)-specific endonuclease VapC
MKKNITRVIRATGPQVKVSRPFSGWIGNIHTNLERKGTPVGPYDLLIAGVALSRNMTPVSNNVRVFSRIEGLRVENWAARPIG